MGSRRIAGRTVVAPERRRSTLTSRAHARHIHECGIAINMAPNLDHFRELLHDHMDRKGLRSTDQRKLIVETFLRGGQSIRAPPVVKGTS